MGYYPAMPTKIHFLNVGHGDCTVIEHPSGRRTMIDINNGGGYDDDTMAELQAAYPPYSFEDYQSVMAGIPLPSLRGRFARAGYKVELTDPMEYYLSHWGKDGIFRYIQSHPDMDH